ncbi:MAG: hypothetical protein ACK4VO_03310 [Pseudobdellovibrio sp.]
MEFKKLLISLNIISTFFVINYVKADTLDLKISHKAVIDDKSNFIGTIIDYYEKSSGRIPLAYLDVVENRKIAMLTNSPSGILMHSNGELQKIANFKLKIGSVMKGNINLKENSEIINVTLTDGFRSIESTISVNVNELIVKKTADLGSEKETYKLRQYDRNTVVFLKYTTHGSLEVFSGAGYFWNN